MEAPKRIWADDDGYWNGFDPSEIRTVIGEYILATPEALAECPEVVKLIAEAEARGMERAADTVRSHGDVARAKLRETYDSGDARGNTLWGCIVGHLDITDDAIRAEAAAIRRAAEETGT